jgi:transposase
MKDEGLENSVITLSARGWPIRRISRELGISRVRIRRILDQNTGARDTTGGGTVPVKKPGTSKLDPYKETIALFLDKYSKATNQRVFEHLKDKGFDGGKTIVGDYLLSIRRPGSKKPVRMVETDPGQRAAHDWSDYNIKFTTGGNGLITKVTFFSYILAYSRRQYIEVVADKTQRTLMRCLINAFIYLDGVPLEIKSDNQKACVDRWESGQPVFNKEYLKFASHYRFLPLTIRPGRPVENLKVERPFYYLELSFLNAREFKDIDDLKEQLQKWLNDVNDVRIHGTTKQSPLDLHVQEHAHLQPLPNQHYDTSHVENLVVNPESCVYWKGYMYVVPPKYMFEICPVRITDDSVIIYSPLGELIATHPLAKEGQKDRYVGAKQLSGKTPDLPLADIVRRLEAMGPDMVEFIGQIKRHKAGSWRHHIRALLALKVNYKVEDILLAVKRATEYKVYDYRTIEGFLSNMAKPRHGMKLNFKTNNTNDEQDQ